MTRGNPPNEITEQEQLRRGELLAEVLTPTCGLSVNHSTAKILSVASNRFPHTLSRSVAPLGDKPTCTTKLHTQHPRIGRHLTAGALLIYFPPMPLDPQYLKGPNGDAVRSISHDWKRVGAKIPYTYALELQELMMEDARKPDLKPIIRAGIARAFVELEMLKLRLRMKPAPKPVDVSSFHKPKPKARSGFTLTPEG